MIVLNHAETHFPVAAIEAGLVSAMRTAAVSTVAVKHLARPAFRTLACVGCGAIARRHLQFLLELFPGVERTTLYDVAEDAVHALVAEVRETAPGLRVEAAGDARAAVECGDVVVLCTVAEEPYVRYEWLRRGTLVCNVSLMDVHDDVLLRADKLVVDDWDQCNREGKPLHALSSRGSFSRDDLHAEIGEIVAGAKPGRETDSEIIVFNPMGMAAVDVACAHAVYRIAVERGIGRLLPL